MILNKNDEIQEYFKILCNNNFPEFIYKYLNTETMQRLKGISFFCGIDYNLIPSHNLKYWYSICDHSIATALIVWNITKNKKQTIVALLHNAGTPIFSHSVDYMLGDEKEQKSSQKNLIDMISKDKELINILEQDKMLASDFKDLTEYTILENDSPRLSADRLDGIFITSLIWTKVWELSDIIELYSSIQEGINEQKNKELAFNNINKAEKFFEGVYKYTYILEQNEEKITLFLIGEALRESINNGIISEKNLYKITEKEFITTLMKHKKSKAYELWNKITKLTFIGRCETPIQSFKCYNIACKRRYVDPLVWYEGEYKRGKTVSKYIENRVNSILFLKDSKYCYIVENL